MKQVRIASSLSSLPIEQRFTCEWMEASTMNRWFLKARLADAVCMHGERTHWIETRDKTASTPGIEWGDGPISRVPASRPPDTRHVRP